MHFRLQVKFVSGKWLGLLRIVHKLQPISVVSETLNYKALLINSVGNGFDVSRMVISTLTAKKQAQEILR